MSFLTPAVSVSTISRNPADYTRDTTQDIHKMFRNRDPKLHPFEKGREYTRALNAVKLDKVRREETHKGQEREGREGSAHARPHGAP